MISLLRREPTARYHAHLAEMSICELDAEMDRIHADCTAMGKMILAILGLILGTIILLP